MHAGISTGALAVSTGRLVLPTLHFPTVAVRAFALAKPVILTVIIAVGAVVLTVITIIMTVVAGGAVGMAESTILTVMLAITSAALMRMPTKATRLISGALQTIAVAMPRVGRWASAPHTMGAWSSSGKRFPLRHGRICCQRSQEINGKPHGIITIHGLISIVAVDGVAVLVVHFSTGRCRSAESLKKRKHSTFFQKVFGYARRNGCQRK